MESVLRMKLLVTGGLGFIGSNFIRYMLTKCDDTQIINLDKLSIGSNLLNLKDVGADERYGFVKGDVSNRELVKSLVNQVDVIVNIASETHVDRSIADPWPFLHSNTIGTLTLLEAARKVNIKTFLQVSTDEIYGTVQRPSSSKETSRLNPSNPYSASKAAADMFVTAYHKTYGLKTIITRCTNNFGPYQFPEKFIAKTIIRTMLNLRIPIYGSGKQIRDWIYINDHCQALDLALRKGKPGEMYNISAGNEIENAKVAELILNLLGKPKEIIEFVEDRPGHDIRYSLDSTKIKAELGWKPRHNFKQALQKTVQWYISNEWWWKPLINEKILHPTPWKLKW